MDQQTTRGRPRTEGEPTDARRDSGSGSGHTRIVALILLVLLAAGGGALYRYWGLWQTKQQAPAMAPHAVTVAKPMVRDLVEWNEFTGQFQAVDSVEVRARVSGYLESIDFTDGQMVKKGDLLFVIEPKPYQLALEQAKANLAQAKANLDLAKSELNRTAQLRLKDFAAQETLDERQATVETDIAAVQSAQAALDQAQLNLDYTHVVAPISGRVSRHEVSTGNLVLGGTDIPSTTLLTTIVSLNPIRLVFNVAEQDGIAYKRAVQEGKLPLASNGHVLVEAEMMGEKGWGLKGSIDFVDNQYDTSTGTIVMRALFPNSNLLITPGQFGRIRVPLSKRKPTILVPDEAVVTDQDSKLLYVVGKDNKVVAKSVDLGPVVGDNLRIVHSGIGPNDEVIVDGLTFARPGAPVSPKQGTIASSRAPKDSDSDIDPGPAAK